MDNFVFAGTRQLGAMPTNLVALFRAAARFFGSQHYVLRTGAAVGSDRLAVEAALFVGGRVEIYTPPQPSEDEWRQWLVREYPDLVSLRAFDPHADQEWVDCVQHSPQWQVSIPCLHGQPRSLLRDDVGRHSGSCASIRPEGRLRLFRYGERPGPRQRRPPLRSHSRR